MDSEIAFGPMRPFLSTRTVYLHSTKVCSMVIGKYYSRQQKGKSSALDTKNILIS